MTNSDQHEFEKQLAITDEIVIAALSGSTGLLFGTNRRRFAIAPTEGPVSSDSHRPKGDHHDRLA
ncbi:hypothetical protein [Brevibacterium pigmentatum]|uniref:hypothetical protein n=1 Tax=Brevibacterium pigmentatum TaxID=1496080 RepID=UPI0014206F81|nr:hypothetical protein [Brevibacterium pigmentatum]